MKNTLAAPDGDETPLFTPVTNRPFLLLCLTCLMVLTALPSHLTAQRRGKKGAVINTSTFARWVLQPAGYPILPLKASYADDQGANVIAVDGHGAEGFLRLSRYRPGGGFSFGLDVGFSQRYDAISHRSDTRLGQATYTEGSLVVGPVFSISRKSIEQLNHPKLTVGLNLRYAIDRGIRYNTTDDQARLINDLAYLKRNSWNWHVGIGNLRERFSVNRHKNKPSELTVFAVLPLLNQADQVRRDSFLYTISNLGNAFAGLRRKGVHFGILYSEVIDFNRNGKTLTTDQQKPLTELDKSIRLLQPMVNGAPPRKFVEGTFSFMGTYQPGLMQVDSNTVNGEVTNLRSSVGWRVGYQLHFGFNRDSYFGPNGEGYINGAKTLWGFYLGGAIGQQVYRFDSRLRYSAVRQTSASVEGALKFGGVRGATVFIGGGYRFGLELQALYGEVPSPALTAPRVLTFFGGVAFGDILVLRVNSGALDFVSEREGSLLERLGVGVGLGF